ncbi:TGF-beta-activated kinase 1 and MAP3K7-binding protein 1-like [Copidosoma floridanum]|uniref:TGF-beta-activated kinase 1 and MAP3K7-binding protein 1-like n=1 Tax=Copidosoma floridanum TaxID=29053 RepID=UPI0006C958C6|nr:TGF-beta-activated kinase 1 and MAP3K7-binding protein 1-like [Copidosoma floridanum]
MQSEAQHPALTLCPAPQTSWTDDLPVCKQSGVGFSTNQIYREDGHRQEEHSFEDRSFHCQFDASTSLYAIFDGYEGIKVADFAMQRLAAEILLGQLNGLTTDEEIKEVLRQAFIAVERSYMDTIEELIAEKTSLQCDIPTGMNSYKAFKSFPEIVNKLNRINCELSSGASAIVALVFNGKLYVANVGDCRALLCKADENQSLRIAQLSIDHTLKNEDELLRLSQLGLDVKSISQGSHLGNQKITRCLGNYLVKGEYKEFEELAPAALEPIIAEPEVHGGIEIDESCEFLLLMSRGLYKSLEEATGTDQVNKELTLMAVEQFEIQSTLTGVAQAVVDKIVRIHHDANLNAGASAFAKGKRDDITLLVRNFNFTMPNAIKSPTGPPREIYDPYKHTVIHMSDDDEESEEDNNYASAWGQSTSSDNATMTASGETPETESDERIDAYVDFSEFYENLEKRKKAGTLPDLPLGMTWF